MNEEKWIFTVLLLTAAVQDLKSRKISGVLLAAGAGTGILVCAARWLGMQESVQKTSDLTLHVLRFLPGAVLLFLSRVTGGNVGAGDGLFFLTAAFYMNGEKLIILLSGGLFFCSIFAAVLLLWGKAKGVDMRKKRLPFLPFLLPVWGWIAAFVP